MQLPVKFNVLRAAAVSAMALLAGACAAPITKLEAPMVETQKADHVVILLTQSEVTVDDVDAVYAGGGLIGALISASVESAMTRNRQEAIAPLRDKLLDFDFERKLVEALQSNLPTELVKQGAEVKIVRNLDEMREHLKTVVPANVFAIAPTYSFEHDFNIAYIHAGAALNHFHVVPPSDAERKKMSKQQRKAAEPKLLHAGSYYSEHVALDPFAKHKKAKGESGYERNARAWADDDAEAVRKAFESGLVEVADMIRRDAGEKLSSMPAIAKKKAMFASTYSGPLVFKAEIVEQGESRSLLRFGANLKWVDNQQIKR